MNTGQKAATKRNGKQQSLTDRAYLGLRKEIITCKLRPGTEVGEQELASRLSMSKTPVRESLVRLTLEGLVEAFPRRGYRITPVTIKDINDVFTVRKALGSVAAELAAVRMSKEELDALKVLADQTYIRKSSLPVQEFVSANNIFHATIAEGARLPRLHALITGYLEQCTRLFHMGATIRDVTSETQVDHTRIIDALCSRDPAAAREAIALHIENTRRGLLSALISNEASLLEL